MSLESDRPIQDLMPHNHCYGCGAGNAAGLRLKSFRRGPHLSVARFVPQAHHCAGPPHFVNGGVLATIIDCHCVCTAVAEAYAAAGREIGTAPHLYFATATLEISYRRPTPIDVPLDLTARVTSAADDRYVLSCEVSAGGKVTAVATVHAVRVPAEWMAGPRA